MLNAMVKRLSGTIEDDDNQPGLRVIFAAPIAPTQGGRHGAGRRHGGRNGLMTDGNEATGIPSGGEMDSPSDDILGTRGGQHHWKQSRITDPSLDDRGSVFSPRSK